MQEVGCSRKHRWMAQSQQQSFHTQAQVHTAPCEAPEITRRYKYGAVSVLAPPVTVPETSLTVDSVVPGSETGPAWLVNSHRLVWRVLGHTLHHRMLSSPREVV